MRTKNDRARRDFVIFFLFDVEGGARSLDCVLDCVKEDIAHSHIHAQVSPATSRGRTHASVRILKRGFMTGRKKKEVLSGGGGEVSSNTAGGGGRPVGQVATENMDFCYLVLQVTHVLPHAAFTSACPNQPSIPREIEEPRL